MINLLLSVKMDLVFLVFVAMLCVAALLSGEGRGLSAKRRSGRRPATGGDTFLTRGQ